MPVKYSFILPVYNCAPYLSACVAGILALPELELEILLIDDGSTDGGGAICDQLAEQDARIRVLHQQNQGVSAARNRGIQEAAGELLLFFDADDTVSPEPLHRLLSQTIPDSPSDLFVFGMSFDTYLHGQLQNREAMLPPFSGPKTIDECREALVPLYYANSLSSLCNKVFRRELLRRYDLRLKSELIQFEDLDFMLRYLSVCAQVTFVQDCIYHYRQSESVDKAKARLMKIPNLSAVVAHVDASLAPFRSTAAARGQADEIVKSLYALLAAEKSKYESISGIRKICGDFADWKQSAGFSLDDTDPRILRLLDRNAVLRIWTRNRLRGPVGRLRKLKERLRPGHREG